MNSRQTEDGRSPTGRATLASHQAPAGLGHAEGIPNAVARPVYEFRPLPKDTGHTVLRYADGAWLPDDGEWDIAFASFGGIAPLGLYVRLPYQRNIAWSGLTTHWSSKVAGHPRGGNAWHYMLRDGCKGWGGDWGRERHPNTQAGDRAMSKVASINGCANGRGPEFVIGNAYVRAGLLREKGSRLLVAEPTHLNCMYCGEEWHHAAQVDGNPKGGDAKQAPGDSLTARSATPMRPNHTTGVTQ